jgi:hypothetical protein
VIRVLIEFALPLALPTVAYFAWAAWDRRRQAALGAGAPREWADAPWVWLIGLGGLAVAAVAVALTAGHDAAGRYVPPHVEDGRVVPGRVEPARR